MLVPSAARTPDGVDHRLPRARRARRGFSLPGNRWVVGRHHHHGGDAEAPLSEPLVLAFYGLPLDGAEITLEMSDRQPVELDAVDQSFELPLAAEGRLDPRPVWLIPRLTWWNDSTFVHQSYWF